MACTWKRHACIHACRYMAKSLEATVLKSRDDGSDFWLLLGVGDSSAYGAAAPPSWEASPSYQDKCYVADMAVSC